MADYYKVLVDALNVRSGSSTDYPSTGHVLTKDATVQILNTVEDDSGMVWGKHSLGWSAMNSASGTSFMAVAVMNTPSSNVTNTVSLKDSAAGQSNNSEFANEINQLLLTKSIYENISDPKKFTLNGMRSILGAPNQFLWTADPRLPNSTFGRLYTENILMDMSLLYITPGGPKFLTGKGIGDTERNSLTQVLADVAASAGNEVKDALERILDGKVARYFSFQTQYADYIKIVNSLNRTSAIYLGIKDKTMLATGSSYFMAQWETEKIEADRGVGVLNWLKNYGVVSFFFNRQSSGMSESGANSTSKSLLDGLFNKASSVSREAQFLLGVGAGRKVEFMNQQNAEQKINTLSDNLMKDQSMFKGILNNLQVGATTVITGANMLLPDIWSDSSFSRSYSIDIQLATPYGDPEAFFLNIMVPLNFILAFAFPRQFGANGYYAPFIIQANAKGIMNCDMGIVDSVYISRFGGGDAISRNGLPLEVQVTMTFRQLYNSMSVNNADNYSMFINNIGLLDFLANFAAINLNDPDISRKIAMFVSSKLNRIADIPANVMNIIYDRAKDAVISMFGR